MAHKMIRCSRKIIGARYDKAMLLLNIPTITAACTMAVISFLIIRNMSVPETFYRFFFGFLYGAVLYGFLTCFVVTVLQNRSLRGHGCYTYMELLGEQMIASEYIGSVYSLQGATDYIRLWVIRLADVEQITVTDKKITIKAKARLIEERADRLTYTADSVGRVEFDYGWFDNVGGKAVDSVELCNNYFYAERAAQRIIFSSRQQKRVEFDREAFRRRMLEIAEGKRKPRLGKKKERIFRGYEIERKF